MKFGHANPLSFPATTQQAPMHPLEYLAYSKDNHICPVKQKENEILSLKAHSIALTTFPVGGIPLVT